MTDDDDSGVASAGGQGYSNQPDDWWTRTDLVGLIKTLERFVLGRYPSLSSYDAEEIATEAITRVIQAAKAGRIKLEGDPTAYLVTVARHIVVDRIRSSARHTEVPVQSVEDLEMATPDDNAIAAFINRSAAAADIRRALSAARLDGDATAFRVITFVLNETERTGHMPSNRDVAGRLGLSHTGVAKALARFRSYVEDGGEASKSSE
jgi:hypothetical protein